MNWVLNPAWSTRLIALLAVVLIALAVMRWWRERRGGPLLGLRTLVIAVLLAVMLNPQSLLPRERTGKPRFTVLVDSSASMSTRDVGDNSRLAAASRILTSKETLSRLEEEFVLEFRRFDRSSGIQRAAGSSASPVQETNAVGMQSVVPLGFSRM
jgi:hypothetical protein